MSYSSQFLVRDEEQHDVRRSIVDGWKAYNITPDKETGIGAWSDDEIERYLVTGHAPAHGTAAGGMAEAIDLSLRHLTSDDLGTRARSQGKRWLSDIRIGLRKLPRLGW